MANVRVLSEAEIVAELTDEERAVYESQRGNLTVRYWVVKLVKERRGLRPRP